MESLARCSVEFDWVASDVCDLIFHEQLEHERSELNLANFLRALFSLIRISISCPIGEDLQFFVGIAFLLAGRAQWSAEQVSWYSLES